MSNMQQMPPTFRWWFQQNIAPRLPEFDHPVDGAPQLCGAKVLVDLFNHYSDEIWKTAVRSERDLVEIATDAAHADFLGELDHFKFLLAWCAIERLAAEWESKHRPSSRSEEFDPNGNIRQWARAGHPCAQADCRRAGVEW
jgi:hypothetical protein